MRTLARVAAALSFTLCLAGGVWIISHTDTSNDGAVWMGIGLYFIGKAFFVGPMLWITAEKFCTKQDG